MNEQPTDSVDIGKTAAEKKQPGLSGWQKTGLGVLTALSLSTTLVGSAGYAARHLPVCEPESTLVEITNSSVCVSPDLSNDVHGLQRVVRGLFHSGEAAEDLASNSNRVLRPKEPRTGNLDGEFTINSWNLHHGTSHSNTGARPQLDLQIEHLRTSDADVDLLQEVLPWHAQQLVDGTGKVGYYSQTTTKQGNLILVSPEFEVSENARLTLNHQVETQEQAADLVNKKGEEEPRAAQLLHLEGTDTNGKSVTVFNTHLSTRSAAPEKRRQEHQVLENFVEQHVSQTDLLIGGGDLNTRDGDEIVQSFRNQNYEVQGASIDWLVSSGASESDVRRIDVRTELGTYVSDHPLVEGNYTIE